MRTERETPVWMLSATGLGCGRILRSLYTPPLSHCVSRIIAKATPYDVPKSVLYYSVPVRSTIIYNVCNKFIAREHAILCRVHMVAIIDVSAKGNVDVLEVVVVSMQVSLRWLQGRVWLYRIKSPGWRCMCRPRVQNGCSLTPVQKPNLTSSIKHYEIVLLLHRLQGPHLHQRALSLQGLENLCRKGPIFQISTVIVFSRISFP